MSVHKRKRKNGFAYEAVITGPRGKQQTKVFKRKIDAEAWEREQRAQLATNPNASLFAVNSTRTLDDLCREWFTKHSTVHKAASSASRDDQIIRNQISPGLGHIRLRDLSLTRIESWVRALREDFDLSPKTANNCLNLLKKILNDGVRWKWLQNNEAKYVQPYKMNKPFCKFWTPNEAKQFMTFIKEHKLDMYPMFALALYAGLRKGEIAGLQWDCVDFNRRHLVIKRIFCRTEGKIVERTKGKKDRTVPMNNLLYDALVEKRVHTTSDLVIPQSDWTHSHRMMDRLCTQAGVNPIRFHDLRHTCASNLVMAGRTIYEVQKLLGHANISTTEQYAHLAPDFLKGVTDCLNFEPEAKNDFTNVISFVRK